MAGCDPAGRKQNWFGLVWFGLSWVPPLETCRAYTLDPIVAFTDNPSSRQVADCCYIFNCYAMCPRTAHVRRARYRVKYSII